MTITYTFTRYWDEYHEDTYEYEYNVPEATLWSLADCYHDDECEDTVEHNEFIKYGGANFEYYEGDEGFYDYVRASMEHEAYEAFLNDEDFWEGVRDAEEYARDPYSYYGVSRWDFV